jgi:hypothetical protein
MTEAAKKVWVQIRAELIVTWHNIHNPGKFINGFSYKKAIEIATDELELDLLKGELRISIDDLLLKSDIECLEILQKNKAKQIKIFLENGNIKEGK